jgi:glyoxylase-like metal-dependent hydrolase (beta-lactamase superfamily II)
VKVIDTHIHADHVTGASKLKDITKCSTIMGDHTPAATVEIKVKDDEHINLDNLKIRAMYTPGHTSDSYSFLMNNYLFSGDTLLINGTGRTDFQNGSSKDAYNSIFNKLLKLPDETLLYPAHDYKGEKVSTIGKEKKYNPRLQVDSVDEYIEIMNNLDLKKPISIDENISKNLKLGA